MANREHLDVLKQGVEAWNQWREKHPTVRPDLSYKGLGGSRNDYSNINFSGTNLKFSSLTFANLSKANLNRTDLMGAYLMGTNLRGASLCGARINVTNLDSADLTEVDMSNATLHYAIFANVDLRSVKGLESVKHSSPSAIDIRTVYRSQGNIPETFLLKAGVPDSFVTYARSLVSRPLEYFSCFISYSNQDEAFVNRLYADLQNKGVRCWFAPEDLKIGDHYHQRIDESIRLYDKLVLILSEQAIQSAWVEREVVAAREKEDREQRLVLFPIRLDDAVMDTTKAWAADVRRRWHIGDFTEWKHHDAYQQSFERLLRDLKAETAQDKK
jgi:TIR domain/Pentapeptide repeats (8 copies)